MHPYQGGGGMIHQVQEQQFSAAEGTAKFEAGTPPIAQAIGLAAAIKWLQQLHWRDIEDYENTLAQYAHRQLSNIDTLQCIAAENQKIQHGTSCLSFTIPNMHPHDLTDILGQKNIHLRAGHHCTQPLHEYLHIPASTRLSLALYNTTEEIDVLCTAIEEAKEILESNR